MTVWNAVGSNGAPPNLASVPALRTFGVGPPGPSSLVQRLAGARPAERAGLLYEAVAHGAVLDLPGANLRRIDLRPGSAVRGKTPGQPDLQPNRQPNLQPGPVVLDGANLAGAMLSGADLSGVSLRGACLDGTLLVGCDLRGADLSGASLRSANLTGACLADADLTFADLRGASLLTADLADTTAVGADLRDALLQSAVLDGSNLRAADLRWSRLSGARLIGADITDARFEGAVLAMTDFGDVKLSPATDFGMAFLSGARFEHAPLSRGHVRGVIGEEITNYALARDTYLDLAEVFFGAGHRADARWARRRAARMAASTHRPDRATRYYASPGPRSHGAMTAFYARHATCWLAGPIRELITCVRSHLRGPARTSRAR